MRCERTTTCERVKCSERTTPAERVKLYERTKMDERVKQFERTNDGERAIKIERTKHINVMSESHDGIEPYRRSEPPTPIEPL